MLCLLLGLVAVLQADETIGFSVNKEHQTGFLDLYVDPQTASVYLAIPNNLDILLYQSSLPHGIGSNDIGLDRGQLSDIRLVRFETVGNKVLLRQLNTRFRALSDDVDEQKSVQEAFAESVLWGFSIVDRNANQIIVDATEFMMRDAHGVAAQLKQSKQGHYSIDASRCAPYLKRCKTFPLNTELEATVTFVGSEPGNWLRQVVPDPSIISVRMHHSFIALPDDGYQPRVHHPESGYWFDQFADYATAIDEPLEKRWIGRHRLQKVDPKAARSKAIKPIVYYLDRGAPEPIRSALLDGAEWWADAFEAAGFEDAFRVELMPEGVDPMDVRYNVIQWVHRATRGWSYGLGVTDPRTGEIIKGHVTLGSLRVRQDYLIAQGMLAPFSQPNVSTKPMRDMALARIRQLSAHEVGHTLGLDHNFAASTSSRASVMDYPHPLIQLNDDGQLVLGAAYAEGIGDWDRRAVIYGYSQFSGPEQESAALMAVINETRAQGFEFINDRDARSVGACHPRAHLWDNGSDAVEELNRLIAVRDKALQNFGVEALPFGQPLSELEDILVPIYFSHRYQVQAVGKWIGGVDYQYWLRDQVNAYHIKMVTAADQTRAVHSLLKTLDMSFLTLDSHILQSIPPKAAGHNRDRESPSGYTGVLLDPISLAEASTVHTFSVLLEPSRLARLRYQSALDEKGLTVESLFNQVYKQIFAADERGLKREIQKRVRSAWVTKLVETYQSSSLAPEVRADVFVALMRIRNWCVNPGRQSDSVSQWLTHQIDRAIERDAGFQPTSALDMPPGSPIGN